MRHEAIIRNLIEALKHICLVAKNSFDKLVLIHEGQDLLLQFFNYCFEYKKRNDDLRLF